MKLFSIIKYLKSLIHHVLHSLYLTKGSRDYYRLRKDLKEFDVDFQKALKQYSIHSIHLTDFLESYTERTILKIKATSNDIPPSEPILICATQNDLLKIRAQIEYHKKIGIKHFAYIDNNSTDGSYSWLEAQDDISLFYTGESYISTRRNAWRKQVMDYFGYERWYLILDSDEFFCYPGIEEISVEQYISYLEGKGMQSTLAPTIDMYSKDALFSTGDDDNFIDQLSYFDTDTYVLYNRFHYTGIVGGPRDRMFSTKTILTKYPLIKARATTLPGSHSNFPFTRNSRQNDKQAIAFLLHYKHLPSDYEKYKEISLGGNYANANQLYRQMLKVYEQNPNITFYYEGSQKYNESMDLLKINVCNKRFFTELFAVYGIET